MNQIIKILCGILIFGGISLINTNVFSQTGIQCVGCGGMNGNHKTSCRYYNPPAIGTTNSANKGVEQMFMEALFTRMLKSTSSTTKLTEQEKLRQQQEELEKKRIEELRAARLKRYNDSIQQSQHEKMMKSYKILGTGVKDLTYKGLIDEKPKWDPSVVVLSEQTLLDTNTQTWVEYQREQFKIRLEQPNYWCKKYYEDLVSQDSLIKTNLESKIMPVPPIKVSEIQPGDVILIGDGTMPGQAGLDAFLNKNDANYNHTVTCIKVVNGKRFYLDNTLGEGPRIITHEQFVARYGERTSNVAQMRGKGDAWGVAQPLNETEANKLWDKAMELHNKNRDNVKYSLDNKQVNMNLSGNTNYGIVGDDNLVCSEASWMLINATGRYQIPGLNNKLISKAGIEFSPASFDNTKQYFLITPLQY